MISKSLFLNFPKQSTVTRPHCVCRGVADHMLTGESYIWLDRVFSENKGNKCVFIRFALPKLLPLNMSQPKNSNAFKYIVYNVCI